MVPGPRPDDGRGRASRGRPDAPDRTDPVARLQRTVLEAVLQHPSTVDADVFDALGPETFSVPALRAVHEAIRAAGGVAAARDVAAGGLGDAAWLERVRDEAAGPVEGLITELAVTPLPEDRPDAIADYVRGVVGGLVDLGLTRQIADLRGRLQRMDPEADADAYQAAFADLVAIEGRRRATRERD